MDDDLLMTFEPELNRIPILKPSLEDNLILLQTPVQKNLKVRFQTPARTPLSVIQPIDLCELSPDPSEPKKIDDEEAAWKERIEVVTKFDHEDYVNSAKTFIEEIVEKVVAQASRVLPQSSLQVLSDYYCDANDGEECDSIGKENISPIDAPFKRKKSSKTTKDLNAEKCASIASTDTSVATLFTANTSLKPPFVDDLRAITEVYIEHGLPTKKESSALKTIYSIFDADELPEELKAEAHKVGQLCNKKNPVHSDESARKIKSTKLPLENSGKNKSESNVSTKKVTAGRLPPIEKPPPEPPQNNAQTDSTKYFTSAEIYQSQSRSTFDDEDFQDANGLLERGFEFDLAFLESKGKDKTTSDLRKQSLYLKFDPLVAGEIPEQAKAQLGRKSDIIDLSGHVGLAHFTEEPKQHKKQTCDAATQPDLLCASPESLRMVSQGNQVCLQQNSSISTGDQVMIQQSAAKRNKGDPHKKISSESFSSLQQPEELKEEIVEILKYTEGDMEEIKEPLLLRIACLQDELQSHKQKIDQMQVVMQEFETTVIEMAEKYEEDKAKMEKEKTELTTEQEKTISHLESVEKAYLELLQRSEQMKIGIGNYKVNEETYKNVISEYQSAQEDAHKRYQALKMTLDETQEKLNNEMGVERKEFRSQLAALKARCKCLENQAKSLQLQLDQKSDENAELTKICDELIEQQQRSLVCDKE